MSASDGQGTESFTDHVFLCCLNNGASNPCEITLEQKPPSIRILSTCVHRKNQAMHASEHDHQEEKESKDENDISLHIELHTIQSVILSHDYSKLHIDYEHDSKQQQCRISSSARP